jgi:hypothetical protein
MTLHFFAIPTLTLQPAQDKFNRIPDYKAASTISENVISAWIAEIQEPRMASVEHIRVAWIPAIHTGMTLLLKQLYNQTRFCLVNSRVLVSLRTAQLGKDALQIVKSILPGWYFAPLFYKEGLGEIFKINPPRSPFVKGGRRLNLPALSYEMRTTVLNYD